MSQQPPELFAQRPVRSDFQRARTRPAINFARLAMLGTVCLAALGGGFGLYLFFKTESLPTGDIPQIEAEMPLKERPENPGGVDIPHQDVQVFSQLDGSAAQNPAGGESLLPAPETPQAEAAPQPEAAPAVAPVEAPAAEAQPQLQMNAPVALEPVADPAPEQTAPAPVVEAPKVETPKVEEPKVEAPKPVKIVPKKKTETAPARLPEELFTGKPAPQARTETGSARVQIASLPNEAAAQVALASYQSKLGGHLGGGKLEIVQAEIAGKGTFYRIMTAPTSSTRAKDICAALKKAGQSCLVAR